MSFGPVDLGLLILILVFILCGWLRYHYDYWSRRGIPQIVPSYFVGNLGSLLRMQRSPAEFIQSLYDHPDARQHPFVGVHIFHKPAIFVRDPTLVKRVLVKDFAKFCDRHSNSDDKGDPIGSMNLFFLKNPIWKEVRFKLSPFFTSCRLKKMFYLIEEVGGNLDVYLKNQPLDDDDDADLESFTFEMKELCALYTTDVIATVAYGVQANSFKFPNGDFRRNGRKVFHFSTKRAIVFMIIFFLPELMPLLRLKAVPVDASDFIRSTINYVMAERERSGKVRNDLIDILIEYKNWSKIQHKNRIADSTQPSDSESSFVFDGDLLVAQAAIFFTAGFETSSATMSFALYELAKRPDIQNRLREEIRLALIASDGQVTQQAIESLEYMQMIIHEVLRLYPPLPFLDRECMADNGYTLQPYANYAMPRGMPVYIPVYGFHMDPKYYPNPDVFDPERFSPVNRKNLTPYTYMPFGLGPHACVGERLAMLQIKIGLTHFLRSHRVITNNRTRIPMQLDRKAIVVQAEGGIYLSVVRDPLNI